MHGKADIGRTNIYDRVMVVRAMLMAGLATACSQRLQPIAPARTEIDDSPTEQTPIVDRPRVVVEGDFPLVCTTTKNALSLSVCFLDAGSCNGFREMQKDSSPCIEVTAGACYNDTIIVTGKRQPICFSSIAQCEEMLTNVRRHPTGDDTDLSTRCGIYRQRQK